MGRFPIYTNQASTGPVVQHGTTVTQVIGAGNAGTFTIVFPKPFATIPDVTAFPNTVATPTDQIGFGGVYNVSTTGCTIRIDNLSSTVAITISASWIAVGT